MSADSKKSTEDMPIGFGLSMAMDQQAMKSFSQMDEKERESWLARAGQAKSRSEMEQLLAQMGKAFRSGTQGEPFPPA